MHWHDPAHPALHESDPTTKHLHFAWANERGVMTRPPTPPIGLKEEEAIASAEIYA